MSELALGQPNSWLKNSLLFPNDNPVSIKHFQVEL